MRRILVVGGGYAGFYAAWGLEKALRPGEAELTVVDPRPYMTYQPFLRAGTDSAPVLDAWAAGDDAAVPDLTSRVPGARTVPNAQHAVRQGKLLARNIAATLRGREPKPYVHHGLGAIATLGIGPQDPGTRRLADRRALRPRHRFAGLGRASPRRLRIRWRARVTGSVTDLRPALS